MSFEALSEEMQAALDAVHAGRITLDEFKQTYVRNLCAAFLENLVDLETLTDFLLVVARSKNTDFMVAYR